MDYDDDLERFVKEGERKMKEAAENPSLEDSDPLELIFVSTIPWISYTSLIQPVPCGKKADSNPRITWGRFQQKDGRLVMPLTVLANHALADGRHIAEFFSRLEENLRNM